MSSEPNSGVKTNHSPCEELRDLIPAYCMELTDPEETRQIERRLPNCPELAAEVEEYRQLARDLKVSMLEDVEQVQPPRHIAYRLMQEASTVPVNTSGQPSRRPIRRGAWLSAAAAFVLIMFGAGLAWGLSRVDQLSREVARRDEVLAFVTANELVAFVLEPPSAGVGTPSAPAAPNATGRFLCHPDSRVGMVQVENFPPAPEGMAYQLWLTRDEERYSGGLFQTNDDGSGMLVFEAPLQMREFRYAGITLEPARGSAAPTSPAVVRGALYP
ncbi:MAG: anti-sigma factor [bacterium]|nr:anti-sigma factor [bacterium]